MLFGLLGDAATMARGGVGEVVGAATALWLVLSWCGWFVVVTGVCVLLLPSMAATRGTTVATVFPDCGGGSKTGRTRGGAGETTAAAAVADSIVSSVTTGVAAASVSLLIVVSSKDSLQSLSCEALSSGSTEGGASSEVASGNPGVIAAVSSAVTVAAGASIVFII